jgi:hypothetical protein
MSLGGLSRGLHCFCYNFWLRRNIDLMHSLDSQFTTFSLNS